MKKPKVILAFSGGLDTSFGALWLKDNGYDVLTFTVDTGGFTAADKQAIEEKSKKLGAVKHVFVDGKQQLYTQFVTYVIKGNILRGGIYPLCVGPERYVIAQKLVSLAKKLGVETVAHCATGAGNDQIRFDMTIKVLAPKLSIIAPVRDGGIARKDEPALLIKHGIPVSLQTKAYSVNKGLVGTTIGGKETNGSWESPPDSVYPTVVPVAKAPDDGQTIILSFKNGLPVALNGKGMKGVAILQTLNALGAKHGVGKNIHLGTTILGIKGRVAFEAPGMMILIKAHTELEKLVLTKWQLFWKGMIAEAYGNFLHEALYYDPVMRDMEAFLDSSQPYVTGDVKVTLYKGNSIVVGTQSPFSLMHPKLATYAESHTLWSGADAKGFSTVYAVSSMLAAQRKTIGGNV